MALNMKGVIIKIILILISILGLIIFLIPVNRGIINIGNVSAILAFAFLLLCTLFSKPLFAIIHRLWGNSAGKVLIIAFAGIVVTGLIIVTLISGFMIYAMNDYPQNNDTVIVLGCKVNGKTPSLMLTKRLEAAYKYLSENEEVIVIVSGGQGEHEEISEAQCMKDYLVNKGIEADRIIMEDKSVSTYENIRNSKEIIEENNFDNSVTIVTDGFHQLRSHMIANDIGLEPNSISADTPLWLAPTYWVREWFGVLYYIVAQ